MNGEFLGVLLPLLVVLGALLGALVWVNKGRGLYRNNGPLNVLQVLAVSSRERVVVLDAGKRIMVLGVASGRVSLLSMLDPADLEDPTS
jgi:flagellar protein FliO/FliZ